MVEGKSTERLLKGTRIPDLFLLTLARNRRIPQHRCPARGTAQVFASLQALKPDFILVDAPPVLAVSDTMILSRQVDGTVVTWNAEEFRAPALAEARNRLDLAGANILGGIYSFDSGKRKGGETQPAGGPRPQAVPRATRAGRLSALVWPRVVRPHRSRAAAGPGWGRSVA